PWWEDAGEAAPQATVERAAVYGTAPLASLPDEQAPLESAVPTPLDDTREAVAQHADTAGLEVAGEIEEGGTRPLTQADMPALVALRSRRGLAAAAQRDIGRVRSINQDSVFAFVTTLPRESSDVTLGLFVVADGMGGHDGGEVASRIAVTTV